MKEFFEKMLGSQPVTLLLIAGVVFIALGAIGGVPVNSSMTVFDQLGRNIFFVVGGILLLIGLFLVFQTTKTSNTVKDNTYGITFEFPKGAEDGKPLQVIGEHPEFGGLHKNKNLGQYVFRLVVYDHARNCFWPQDPNRLSWGTNGKWSAWTMFEKVGDEKTIIAVLVPPSGSKLYDYYRQNSKTTNYTPVQGPLPEDFIKIGEIKAKRVA